MDFGTGGLDLAYEVMRGYDALVIVDVSRQGGEPGTLYVMEPEESEVEGGHRGRRGDQPARDGPEDRAALRQVGRRLAGQGGDRRLRAGRRSRTMGMELSDDVAGAVERAVDTVLEQVAELQSNAAYGGVRRARALALQRDPRDGPAPRRRPPGHVGADARSARAPGRPRVARLLLRDRHPRHRSARARASRPSTSRRGCAARAARREWEPEMPAVPLPGCGGAEVEVLGGASSMSSRSWSRKRRRRNASHQGEGRRGRAGRQHDDRPGQPRRLRPRTASASST